MDWKENIAAGMKMIMEGCDQEGLWYGCRGCPFGSICDAILRDEESVYTTPDYWEEEGIFKTPLDTL